MSYTAVDVEASSKFADYNVKVRLLEIMHKNAPHLVSHLKINIRDATNDDFYVPKTLKHAAKIITVDMSEKLCKMLSCNPMKENAPCTPNTSASYYYVGDDSYDIQCQPSCFHTAKKVTYNDDGSRAVDVPMLNWNDGKCRIVNSNIVSWLEKTYYRSDTKYETRVNDMPTGFSRVPSDNKKGCGFTYKTNPAYCNYFDRTFSSDGSCSMSILDTILDATIGMSLINNLKSSIRVLVNGKTPFDYPSNMPALPSTVPYEYTLKGWQESQDPSFALPKLIDTSPKAPTRAKRDLREIDNDSGGSDDDDDDYEEMSGFLRNRMGLPKRIAPRNDDDATKDKNWLSTVKDVLIPLLEMLTEKDFWINRGIDFASTVALSHLKKAITKVATKLTAFLAKDGLITLGGAIGIKVLSTGIRGLFVRVVATTVLRTAARAALILSKMLVAASSVIGWIFLVSMFLDLMFQFWDPYGYKNLFPPELPDDMMVAGELALRQALSSATTDYTFDNLCGILLSEDEMFSVQIESLLDRLTYLDSLVVNSEGTRIDKGNEIDADTQITGDRLTVAGNQLASKRVHFNRETFDEYNRRFVDRITVNRYLNYAASAAIISSLTFVAFSGFSVLTILAFLISVMILCMSMFNLYNDSLIDLYGIYKQSNNNRSGVKV